MPPFTAALLALMHRRALDEPRAAALLGVPLYTLTKWTAGTRAPSAAAVRLLDVLATLADFPAPDSMVSAEFDTIWQRIEADKAKGELDEEDKAKDEDTLKSEYRAISERRVKLGLLLSEIGRVNSIQVGPDEMNRAMRQEASRYQGQEQMVMDFFRKNPQAAESLRGPIFEEKVVDFVLELANVTDQVVTPEELAKEPEPETAA